MFTHDIRTRKPRASKYDKATHPDRAHGLALLGYIDIEIAVAMGISESTLYNWKRNHPGFSSAIERGHEPVDVEITQALYKRAKGGYVTEDKVMKQGGEEKIVQVSRYIEPSDQAIIYWLNNRRGRSL